jgi:hypothetical protein
MPGSNTAETITRFVPQPEAPQLAGKNASAFRSPINDWL